MPLLSHVPLETCTYKHLVRSSSYNGNFSLNIVNEQAWVDRIFCRSFSTLSLNTIIPCGFRFIKGVTHLPEVYFIDLLPIFSSLESSRRSDHDRSCSDSDISSINSDSGSVSCSGSGSGSGSDTCRNKCSEEDGSQRESVLCLVLATDGVWYVSPYVHFL